MARRPDHGKAAQPADRASATARTSRPVSSTSSRRSTTRSSRSPTRRATSSPGRRPVSPATRAAARARPSPHSSPPRRPLAPHRSTVSVAPRCRSRVPAPAVTPPCAASRTPASRSCPSRTSRPCRTTVAVRRSVVAADSEGGRENHGSLHRTQGAHLASPVHQHLREREGSQGARAPSLPAGRARSHPSPQRRLRVPRPAAGEAEGEVHLRRPRTTVQEDLQRSGPSRRSVG